MRARLSAPTLGLRLFGSFVLSLSLLAAAGMIIFAAIGAPAPPQTLDERTRAVAEGLRCPACGNLSIADSSSGVAQDYRELIHRGLRTGKTPEEIRREFVKAYGEWILLSPAGRGVTLVVWVTPIVVLVLGVVIGVGAVRRWTADPTGNGRTQRLRELSPADRRLLATALARLEEDPG
ncbi:MAG: cytochrome c-type biogenesis protein [Actinomycetota bacterium]